MQIEDI